MKLTLRQITNKQTKQITFKYSHHWAEVHFQGNAEKGPLVGSPQVFLEVFVFLVTTG